MNRALGLIEVCGLVAAVSVADDMVKCANVELIGYELAKGSGMATIKIEGDVGAVQAAISCGETTARNMNMFVSRKVIARPAEGLQVLINNKLTVGCAKADEKISEKAEEEPTPKTNPSETPLNNKPEAAAVKSAPKSAPKPEPKSASKPAPAPTPKTAPKSAPKPTSKSAPNIAPEVEIKPEHTNTEASIDKQEDNNEK